MEQFKIVLNLSRLSKRIDEVGIFIKDNIVTKILIDAFK